MKDTLHVVDDFHPSAKKNEALSMESTVQTLVRNYANRTSRGRLNTDLTEQKRRPPRGMLLITAEELPTLESTLARMHVVEMSPGCLDKEKMTILQRKASLLPAAMVSFILWVAENIESIISKFPDRFITLREKAATEGFHKRLPEQVAYLGFSLELIVSWLVDRGVMTDDSASALVAEGWEVFKSLAAQQSQRIADDDPVHLFSEILETLITQHKVRLNPASDDVGESLGAGPVVGHYDSAFLYLSATAIWHEVQTFCIRENTYFPYSKNTFLQILKNRGIIASNNGESTVIVKINGKNHRVIKIIDRGVYYKTVTSVTGT